MTDGNFPTLVSKDRDANTVTNPIIIQISDGTSSATIDASTNGLETVIVNEDVLVSEGTAATKGFQISLDDGTDSVFAQANVTGDLKVTLDTETVQISADSSANSASNPIFVEVTSGGSSGLEVCDYDHAVDTAADGSTNHDYAVVGTEFLLQHVDVACSGASKFEIQVGPIAGLVSKMVAFIPRHGGFECCIFQPAIIVPATGTGTVRIIKTNRENQTNDLYSSILGSDIP
ncbi:MAG: hypothetical protein DRH08_10575 [Deltaproteobacteria bacterium]|nr:MAG: hypothetical protein DRH08_10575 [Deltaproteobacteria bacterium]